MKNLLILLLIIEVTALSALLGLYIHHRHYKTDNYSYVVLAEEADSYRMGLNWESLRSFYAFMVLAELTNTTAVKYSANFCSLTLTCFNERDRQSIDMMNENNYLLARSIAENMGARK